MMEQNKEIKPVEQQQQQPVGLVDSQVESVATSAISGPQQVHFVSRVYNLPLVNSTIGSIYETTKYYTPVLVSTVENSATHLSTAVKPYEYVYINPLKAVDQIGCKGLDNLEKTFPVITEPTDKVYEYGRQYVDTRILQPVKSVQDSVTPYIDSAITRSDQFIDTILPADEEEVKKVSTENGVESNGTVIPKTELPATVSGKVYQLGTKVGGRIQSRANKGFQIIGTKTDEQIKQMKFTVDLIQYANENLDKQAKLISEKMDALKSYVQNSKFAQSFEKNISVNLQDYRNSLHSGVETIISQIKTNFPTLPTEFQNRINQIQESINFQLAKIKNTNNQQELTGIYKIATESFNKLNEIKDFLIQSIHVYTHRSQQITPSTEETVEKTEKEIQDEITKSVEVELEKELQEEVTKKENEVPEQQVETPVVQEEKKEEDEQISKKSSQKKKKGGLNFFSSPTKN